MRILHLMSCRGWSSDAYWAARMTRELGLRGHAVTLGCRAGTEAKVIGRARAEGVEDIVTFGLQSGLRPSTDLADLRQLRGWLRRVDIVHAHRSKEHWLSAMANRLSPTPRPLVRTRHIVQAVRPHAANRWLYGQATTLVVTVTEAIRRQYLATGLLPPERVVTLRGGADVERFQPRPANPVLRRQLGAGDGQLLIGMIGGLRGMKGHALVVDAARRLADDRLHFAFVGGGNAETAIRDRVRHSGLVRSFTMAGFADDPAATMAALDVALYVPVESEGMSRVVWEYLAVGCPLIASRVGVVSEVLRDGEHALLVHAGDASALAGALRRLVHDPALRARLGEAGRRLVVDRYSGAALATQLEERYRRLVP
ncbi:MAG: glycosyltransferase family 4 protein [Candidatus Rokuibacteriota bacterium]